MEVNRNLPPSFYDVSGKLSIDQQTAKQVEQLVQDKLQTLPPQEQKVFLSLLKTADIAPGGTVADIDGSLDRLTTASNKLVAAFAEILSNLGSDSLDFLSRALVEMAAEQRKEALQSRLNAHQEAKTQLENQASKMQESADKMVTGAIVSIVMAVASAVISLVSAGVASSRVGKALDATTDLTQQAALKSASIAENVGQGLKGASDGMGNFGNTYTQAESKRLDAEGSLDAAQAEGARSKADISKEFQSALEETIKSIINFLKELKDAQAEQMRSLTRL